MADADPAPGQDDLRAELQRLSARLDELETRGGVLHDVRRYGAVGDGVTDDTDAIQAASRAAGSHGIVLFGRGRFLLTRTVVVPPDQQWQGVGIADTSTDSDPVPNTLLTRVSDGPAIDARYNTTFKQLRIEGSGSGTGMVVHGRVVLEHVSLQRFDLALECLDLWYGHFTGLRLYRNRVGVRVERAYNLTLIAPRINCVDPDDRAGIGLSLADNVDVKIFGGAIEAYSVGIKAAHHDSIHLHSVYFESNPPHPELDPVRGAVGVQLSGTRSSTVTALGCYVYLTNQRVWIDADGAATTASIVALGNTFKGGNPPRSGLHQLAYRWADGSGVRATISGDQWNQVEYKGNASYLAPGTSEPGGSTVVPPPLTRSMGSRAVEAGRRVRERLRPLRSRTLRTLRRLVSR
ncbi:glycosyl hydrolase family 28-related protein [Aestuariimicrobium sp. T2.26MG-19.2B]|uniref:glycosyl hydrolase family 28-related protein n=1 Tax=Aestuariimicrobium sp. T2.26MG-19.2B TaxID=3040679 RepID=UPI0024774E63|nr:glycosyl hydrolase family 28-related protein [Aestuariimicrobium sp. T2.26MG-19.2B]CAI9404034.1 hypothetical protein AESSP_01126 [Aestuariimicrobium sp. T2.26MG-19.2B]